MENDNLEEETIKEPETIVEEPVKEPNTILDVKPKPVIPAKVFTAASPASPGNNVCRICEKRVYPMEKITADGVMYHRTCFKCTECKKTLNLGNFAASKSLLFCKPHYTQRFKLHGNYDTGFALGSSLRNPQSTVVKHS